MMASAGTGIKKLPLVRGRYVLPAGKKTKVKQNENKGEAAPSFPSIDDGFTRKWSNVATHIGVMGYRRMRTSDPVANAVGLLGDEVGKLKLFAFAPKAGIDPHGAEALKPENQSERAQAFQKIYDKILGITPFQQKAPWSLIEGVLFWQIRWVFVEGVGLVPDLRWGERRKVDAGGNLYLHADHQHIIQKARTTANSGNVPAEVYSTLDWIVLKPGTSDNPEGDGELALRLNKIAQLYDDGDLNSAIFAKTMTLPWVIMKSFFDIINAEDVATRQANNESDIDYEARIELLQLGDGTVADIMKYPTDGATFLMDRETRLEGRAMKAINNTPLMSDTRATGPTGSSKEARTTANAPVINFANVVAEAVTCYLNPSIIERNGGLFGVELPPIAEGETEVSAQYMFPGELGGDTNPTRDSAADVVPEEKRPDPEGTGEKKNDSDEVK